MTSELGTLYALDAATGKELWTFGPAGANDPAVANGVVYMGEGTEGYAHLYALDAVAGALLWSQSHTSSSRTSPTVVNGVVYSSSTDHGIYAFGL